MSQVLASLDEEWARIVRSHSARRALRRWAKASPAFVGLTDLDHLLRCRRDPTTAKPVLYGLARLAPTDGLAARTLLQAMIPGIVIVASVAAYDDPGAIDEMVSLAWERIRTYPTSRTGPVAGNILLDVRKRYRAHRSIEAPRSSQLPEGAGGTVRSVEDEVVTRLMFWEGLARYRSEMGEGAFRALVRTRIVGLSLADVAAEERVNVHAVTQRRWRAVQVLAPLREAG